MRPKGVVVAWWATCLVVVCLAPLRPISAEPPDGSARPPPNLPPNQVALTFEHPDRATPGDEFAYDFDLVVRVLGRGEIHDLHVAAVVPPGMEADPAESFFPDASNREDIRVAVTVRHPAQAEPKDLEWRVAYVDSAGVQRVAVLRARAQ